MLDDGTLVQGVDSEMRFSSRMRLLISMSFESDLGLTFGGSFRADNAADANDGLAGSVFVSGDFGKLAMGDVSSAAEAAVGNISGVGYTGLGDLNETFYLDHRWSGPVERRQLPGSGPAGCLVHLHHRRRQPVSRSGQPDRRDTQRSDGGTFGAGAASASFEGVAVNSGDTFNSYNQVQLGCCLRNRPVLSRHRL